jgi:RNA-directed DNA polymerase
MSEDALVNTSAVNWPDADSAYFTVRRMQTKLHHWATQEPGRRFGDLHNLVYDPAFLMAAWERQIQPVEAFDSTSSVNTSEGFFQL